MLGPFPPYYITFENSLRQIWVFLHRKTINTLHTLLWNAASPPLPQPQLSPTLRKPLNCKCFTMRNVSLCKKSNSRKVFHVAHRDVSRPWEIASFVCVWMVKVVAQGCLPVLSVMEPSSLSAKGHSFQHFWAKQLTRETMRKTDIWRSNQRTLTSDRLNRQGNLFRSNYVWHWLLSPGRLDLMVDTHTFQKGDLAEGSDGNVGFKNLEKYQKWSGIHSDFNRKFTASITTEADYTNE